MSSLVHKCRKPFTFHLLPFALLLCLLPLTLGLLSAHKCWSATYYVDATNGDDNHDGLSSDSAWKSIAKVNSCSFQPGDFILLKKGEIWREQLIVSSTGSVDNPITFGPFGSGESPIIKGSDVLKGWVRLGVSNIYYLSTDKKPVNVYEDDKENPLDKVNSIQELEDLKGSWYYDSSDNKIYIQTKSGDNPSNHTIEAANRDFCIYSERGGNYIIINNIAIKYAGSYGIYCSGNDNWIIKNSNFENNFRHLYVGGNAEGSGSATGTIIQNNDFKKCDLKATGHWDYASVKAYGCFNLHICDNYFETVNNMAFHARSIKGGAYSEYGEVYKNELTNCNGGIEVTDSDFWKVYRNYIHNGKGMGVGFNYGSDNGEIYYNIIYNLVTSVGASTQYNGIDINCNAQNGKIFNNVVKKVSHVCFTIEDLVAPCDGWEIKNNIFDARENSGGNVPVQVYSGIASITFRNNIYVPNYTGQVGKVGRWKGEYVDLNDWIKYSGDRDSISEDPMFRDVIKGGFSLQPNSPAIDAGIDVGLSVDYKGNPIPQFNFIDIGAIEYQGPATISSPNNLRIVLEN